MLKLNIVELEDKLNNLPVSTRLSSNLSPLRAQIVNMKEIVSRGEEIIVNSDFGNNVNELITEYFRVVRRIGNYDGRYYLDEVLKGLDKIKNRKIFQLFTPVIVVIILYMIIELTP